MKEKSKQQHKVFIPWTQKLITDQEAKSMLHILIYNIHYLVHTLKTPLRTIVTSTSSQCSKFAIF